MLFLNSTDLCVVFLFFFFFFQASQNVSDMCVTVFLPPPGLSGKMAAKEPHQVLSLCVDIHLGNGNGAIITASRKSSSSIYSCWVFLGVVGCS